MCFLEKRRETVRDRKKPAAPGGTASRFYLYPLPSQIWQSPSPWQAIPSPLPLQVSHSSCRATGVVGTVVSVVAGAAVGVSVGSFLPESYWNGVRL